ncbi:hypothetical protein TrRE_jg3260 [Triparma retinervis]|uniref:Fatty acid desaturase domain-containing protein n=1 Tax=Triparma retinervis TaxID=2557542 RepID=A0A9W7A3R8_9STRA|nr:hypothetical protein TrRE_jg3260 [Triparma retinervis]
MGSIWQLQILHDCCHNTFSPSPKINNFVLQSFGAISYYGYAVYLKHGHLSHHSIGGSVSPRSAFNDAVDFLPDGDVLFNGHRSNMKGDSPRLPSMGKPLLFREDRTAHNALVYALTFSFERIFLGLNDFFTSIIRKNLFFPNASPSLSSSLVRMSTFGTLARLALASYLGPRIILSLYLAELSWCIPPNPLAGCFLNNHASQPDSGGGCEPTMSYKTGNKLYSALVLNTNHHKEHHDFPSVPFHGLGRIKEMGGYGDLDKGGEGGGRQGMELWFGRGGTYGCQ